MEYSEIKWLEKIAENQQFRSTWKVEISGVPYIAKKIENDSADKLAALIASLKRQIRFSEILNDEEQKKIFLYEKAVESDGSVAFIRKFCEGVSLDKLLCEKRFSILEAVNIVLDIARVVQIAHDHGICHGDLKPANIIISDQKEISIIDWDTMSIRETVKEKLIGSEVTVEQICGTPCYMPVELFQGKGVNEQSDVYALGIILYQILTGETPFDKTASMSAAQMAIYKLNHEPDSIIVKFPQLGVPDELAKIIEESLKNDLNQRIQNIGAFINRLETIGKVSATKETELKATDAAPKYIPAKVKGNVHNLVLIGHTGSGKTVLSAGLYATQDRDFSVEDPGAKTQTGIHAINTKTIIEKGKWPNATSVGTIINLLFRLNYKGREEAVSFREFAGELLDLNTFDKDFINNPDGAFILINPGASQWHDILTKNKLIASLKYYINLLSKKENHPPIALVVTASDRLESDLKDFAPQFNKYINELVLCLEAKKCVFKVFHVSVSGILENQNKPTLNPQHIKDPFIWLLKIFLLRARKKTAVKFLKVLGVLLALFALLFGGNCWREYNTLSKFSKTFQEVQRKYNEIGIKDNTSLLNYRNDLVNLRCEVCTQKHVGKTNRLGKCDSKCSPKFLLNYYQRGFQKQIDIVEQQIDETNGKIFSNHLKKALNKANPENIKNFDEIYQWEPLLSANQKLKSDLLLKRNQELPLAIERFNTNELINEFNEVIQQPGVSMPFDLLQKYDNWKNLKSVLSTPERQRFLTKLSNLYNDAGKAVEDEHCQQLIKYLGDIKTSMPSDVMQRLDAWKKHQTFHNEQERQEKDKTIDVCFHDAVKRVFENDCQTLSDRIINFKGTVNQLSVLIRDYFSFVRSTHENVDSQVLSTHKADLKRKMLNQIDQQLANEYKKYYNDLMSSDTYEPWADVKDFSERIVSQLSSVDQARLSREIEKKCNESKNAWEDKQHKKVTDWIARNSLSSGVDALDELKEFYMNNRENPYLREAENHVFNIVIKEIYEIKKNFGNTEDEYGKLERLCVKIRSTPSKFIQQNETNIYQFAKLYCNWFDDNPKLNVRISKIEGSSSYAEGAYIYKAIGQFYDWGNEWDVCDNGRFLINKNKTPFYSSWSSIDINCFNENCKPWQFLVISFLPYENIEWAIDTELKKQFVIICPSLRGANLFHNNSKKYVDSKNGYYEISFGAISLRIYVEISGETLNDIFERCKL